MTYTKKNNPTTPQRIISLLEKGDMRIVQLADALSLTEVPVRRAIMRLLADGTIHVCDSLRFGRSSRRSRVFRVGGLPMGSVEVK